MEDTTLVPQTSTVTDNQSYHHTSHAKSTAKLLKRDSSNSGKQNITVSSLEGFGESLIDSGL